MSHISIKFFPEKPIPKFYSGYERTNALWNQGGLNKIKSIFSAILDTLRNILVLIPNKSIDIINLKFSINKTQENQKADRLAEPSFFLKQPSEEKGTKNPNLFNRSAAAVWEFAKTHPLITVGGIVGIGVLGIYGLKGGEARPNPFSSEPEIPTTIFATNGVLNWSLSDWENGMKKAIEMGRENIAALNKAKEGTGEQLKEAFLQFQSKRTEIDRLIEICRKVGSLTNRALRTSSTMADLPAYGCPQEGNGCSFRPE